MATQSISEILLENPVEDLLYLFADKTVLLSDPRMLYRYDAEGERFYYTIEGADLSIYISTTTFTKRVLGIGPELLLWYQKNGWMADILRDQAADYGTLMHIDCATYSMKGYDFSKTRETVTNYVKALGHPLNLIGEWTKKLNKNIASWAQFCQDYKFEPILIEGRLASETLGIAGTLDYVGYITNPKTGKRSLIQIDLKSGGIWESAEAQLAVNKVIFEENFPHLKLEGLYNWSPKDYQKEPTYTFVDQTKSAYNDEDAINAMLILYGIKHPKSIAEKKIHVFDGKISIGSEISESVRLSTIKDSLLESFLNS